MPVKHDAVNVGQTLAWFSDKALIVKVCNQTHIMKSFWDLYVYS